MNYNLIKKNIREIGLMFLSVGLLLFLSCGSDDTKDVSGENGDVNSNQYLQVQPNGLNVIKVSSSDVAQVVYPFSVELKGGSASVALTAQLEAWNEKDLEAYNKEEETDYKLLPSSLYSISAPQITLEQGIASKKVEVKFAPDKVFTEFKKNGTEYVIALRLTSSVAKVRKSQSDFLLHISFDYPTVSLVMPSQEISVSKMSMPVSVDATFNCRADGEIQTNPWNFTCTLAVPSNAEELVAKYNEDYKTSYRLLPSANYDLGEGISFKAGENEATGGIIVKREGMEAVKYLLPVQLREASHESVALHNEICYFKIGMTYTNPVITFSSAADPTVIRTDEGFYLYATQTNSYWIPIYFSKDLVNWEFKRSAFRNATRPKPDVLPDGGAFWAPEIRYINGKYVLYFSWAKWGDGSKSYTAVATSDSPVGDFLNAKPLLITDDFGSNCIDQFYYEEDGKKYMFVGSFNGIYVTELTDDGLSVKRGADGKPVLKKQVCGRAFEGTNIYKKGKYYYLFASINNCCDGIDSRYKVVVGRSENLLGPYVNREGKDMMSNSWTLVLEGDGETFFGPGHNSIIIPDDAGTDWMIYHSYVKENGAVGGRLGMLDRIVWSADGWPTIKKCVPSKGDLLPVFNN
ncbi:family 43 glycosylhydrolase [Bacteroides caecimuris]|jgi:GH43 family beta-xylosidase|uniref:Arabinan endo-1,5-alpha-L-arabinosidase n=1 Tax=Bacteroides caecimuris TaxID=1796613 RepID=A0A1C7H3D9_9BACE|nr:family 43 glycosylhydrolase [Bacteroides caecimuris]ANU59135.1 arabinan endo-1,5-alpha-L-arabinosidase [Bacteroides caecimuris]NDO61383.1 family 43 glycosylhydrolase [Bacteroides caecimuris]OXE68256.1 arabinan endo-1,5-alpha-L-arabinosidase [Bacteroides caecimuris]QQR15944.1 family 43 glycosylhydrolase [Bacteroides caecimuris]UQA28887.1 family 43 glycosylhydrolase [Bacteroides caecimuris]